MVCVYIPTMHPSSLVEIFFCFRSQSLNLGNAYSFKVSIPFQPTTSFNLLNVFLQLSWRSGSVWGLLPEVPQRAVCSSGSLDLQAEVLLSIEVAILGKKPPLDSPSAPSAPSCVCGTASLSQPILLFGAELILLFLPCCCSDLVGHTAFSLLPLLSLGSCFFSPSCRLPRMPECTAQPLVLSFLPWILC